jgi:hypothetical protein
MGVSFSMRSMRGCRRAAAGGKGGGYLLRGGGGVLRVLAGQVPSLDGGVMGCRRPIQSAYWPPKSEYAATGGAAAAACALLPRPRASYMGGYP